MCSDVKIIYITINGMEIIDPSCTSEIKVSPLSSFTLTYIPEIDQRILLFLSRSDLHNVCLANKYLYQLCQDDLFWHERIRLDFKEEGDVIAQEKHPSVTWKQWYLFWYRDRNRNLVFTLNFNPIEAYKQIISERSLIYGTEAFQTIDVTLEKAILAHDKDLYNYFKEKFYSLAKKYYQDNKAIFTRLINYSRIIPLALKEGYDDLAKELIIFMKDERNLFLHEDKHQLVSEMGRFGFVDLYFTKLLPLLNDEDNKKDLDSTFLSGLIMGFHNQEAKEMFKVASFTSGYGYVHYMPIASKVDNVEFVNFLHSLIPKSQEEEYLHSNSGELPSNYLGLKIIEEEGIKIYLNETNYDPNKSFDYYFTSSLQKKTFSLIEVDHVKVSEERLYEIFKEVKSSPYNLADLISSCVNAGRYPLIHHLDFDDLYLFGYIFWQRTIGKIVETHYKDLFLYLIAHLKQYNTGLYQHFIDGCYEDKPISYEIYLLIQRLKNSSVASIEDIDYYSLLTSIYH